MSCQPRTAADAGLPVGTTTATFVGMPAFPHEAKHALDDAQLRANLRHATGTIRAKRAEVRIPFGQVIERGMLRPGEELFSIGNRHKAKVRADGSLIGNDVKGSIHQVGAALEGAPSCNGWTYWRFKSDQGFKSIDALRAEVRAGMQ